MIRSPPSPFALIRAGQRRDLPCLSRQAGTGSLAPAGTQGSSAQTAAGGTPAAPGRVRQGEENDTNFLLELMRFYLQIDASKFSLFSFRLIRLL